MKKLIAMIVTLTPFIAQADLVSENLGTGAYSASSQYLSFAPGLAFDGDLAFASNWNSGIHPLGWIEVDLGQSFDITDLSLVVAQDPNGNTMHEVWVSNSAMQADLSGATLVHTFDGYTVQQQTLTAVLPSSISAQYVQIRTTSSPSWVAWFEIQVFAFVPPPTVNVGVDIKPGSYPNSINLSSGGTTPVAILGAMVIDVNDIDMSTLALGTSGVKTVGKTDRTMCSVADVSGDFSSGLEGAPDGFDDLVCHFVTMSIVPEGGDAEATLSGEFIDGTSIEGTDSVNIVP